MFMYVLHKSSSKPALCVNTKNGLPQEPTGQILIETTSDPKSLKFDYRLVVFFFLGSFFRKRTHLTEIESIHESIKEG